MKNNYTLGLDIGIGSIGWALIDQENTHLIDMGVRMFNEAEPAKTARSNRSARRTQRRKKWRENQLLDAFVDFGIVTRAEISQPNYLSYTVNTETFQRPLDETVYHLRLRALHEKVSKRELILCLYNICKTRGHFLLETVDFERDTVTYDLFAEKFHELIDAYVQFDETDRFNKEILKPLFNEKKIGSRDLQNQIKKNDYGKTDEDTIALIEICKLIAGYKGNLSKIDTSVELPEKRKQNFSVNDLLKEDTLNDFLDGIVELHDLIRIAQTLKNHDYICEIAVERLNEVHDIYKLQKIDSAEYEKKKEKIQNNMNLGSHTDSNRLRVIKNMMNNYPNGLYVKEARAILRKQQEFYPEITNAFIDICLDVIKARIPYYIGPLSPDAANAWLKKTGKFKYSYKYSEKDAVDVNQTIKDWKARMISHCTYLPEEPALPKGSFLAETFSILNEMNILTAADSNGDTYYLTTEDKLKMFDNLFLKQEKVTFKNVCELLDLQYFGTRKNPTLTHFRNKYTLYKNVSSILPVLKVDHILDLFKNKEKIDKIEDIILNINLFDEEVSKKEYFIQEGFGEEEASKLSKLKSKKFYSFSKKFIYETPMDTEGNTLIEKLFDNNMPSFVNEQMTLIHNATDLKGNPIDFESNKYVRKLKERNVLDVHLLLEEGKPIIPISRSVVRALNECFKVYSAILDTYGVPERVVIETARELHDSSQIGKIPAKHFDKMKDYYDDLKKQFRENKSNKLYHPNKNLADWNIIEAYLTGNKRKVELYIRQNGRDMITGDPIQINRLEDYEIDHILPRGFGDNSMDNLMLISKFNNDRKSNRVPLEYIEQDKVIDGNGNLITSKNYEYRVQELFRLGMISQEKQERLLLKDTKDVEGFINRNLVDTRYIIKELMSILRAYDQVNAYDTHIVALKSTFTNVYRHAFNMRKNRKIGDQHHAHDAAILAMADHILSTYYILSAL